MLSQRATSMPAWSLSDGVVALSVKRRRCASCSLLLLLALPLPEGGATKWFQGWLVLIVYDYFSFKIF